MPLTEIFCSECLLLLLIARGALLLLVVFVVVLVCQGARAPPSPLSIPCAPVSQRTR